MSQTNHVAPVDSTTVERPRTARPRRLPWLVGPAEPTLRKDEAHVWCAPLGQPPTVVEALAGILAPDEHERADRFYFAQDREHFIVARGLLRRLLSAYLGVDPASLRFDYGVEGKPELREPAGSELCFNVSQSCGLALFAVTQRRQIGIDLEYFRPSLATERVAERYFSSRELTALRILPAPLQRLAFFHCWTRKEAYLKGRGDGLTFGAGRVHVSVEPDLPARLLNVSDEPDEVGRWLLADLSPERGYIAALAVEGSDLWVRTWTLPTPSSVR